MTDQKKLITVPSAIPPHEILRIAKEECEVWGDLAFGDDSIGSRAFLAMAKTVTALTEVGNEKAVRDAIYMMVAWCEKCAHKIAPIVSSSEVEHKLEAIQEWLEQVQDNLISLSEEKEEISDLGQRQLQQDRYNAIQAEIDKLVALKSPIEAMRATLEHYLSSLSVVESGVSPDMLNTELPVIPEVQIPDESGAPAPEKVARSQAYDVSALSPELALLVEKHVYHPVHILLCSVFDLFGPLNAILNGATRGTKRMLETLLSVGILKRHGKWETVEDALKGSHWKTLTNTGLVIWKGNVGRWPTYHRSTLPLPWDVRMLFTEKEASALVAFLKQRGTPPPNKEMHRGNKK